MKLKNSLEVVLNQLNFMQTLFPHSVNMDYKRTGSFVLTISLLSRGFGGAVPVTYEVTYIQGNGKVKVSISSERKTIFSHVTTSFEEVEGTIKQVIKPNPPTNSHVPKMVYEAYWLMRQHIKNRPTTGFMYISKFDSHTHRFFAKNRVGEYATYAFQNHSFPLIMMSLDGKRCFNNEQALSVYLSKR